METGYTIWLGYCYVCRMWHLLRLLLCVQDVARVGVHYAEITKNAQLRQACKNFEKDADWGYRLTKLQVGCCLGFMCVGFVYRLMVCLYVIVRFKLGL